MKNAPTATLESLTDGKRKITYGVVKPGDPDPCEGIIFIRGGDISEGRINIPSLRTIHKDVSDQYKRTLLKGGELLVSLVGNPGEVASTPKKLAGANIARQVGLIDLTDDVCHKFVEWFLRSPQGQAEMGLYVTGAVQKVINLADLKRVKIPLPKITTQRKIASILSAYDDLIENNTRRIEILEDMARRLYEEWFVHFRFPGHEEVSFKESELGEIPEGWEVATIGEAVKRFTAGDKYSQKTVSSAGAIPVLDQGKQGVIGYHDDSPGFLASPNDPVIVFANHTCYQRLIFYPFSTIQNVIPFKSSDKYMRNVFWLHHATHGLVELNDYKGHWPQFAAKKIPIAEKGMAESFGKFVEPMYHQMLALYRKNANLRAQRDLLLPKLISGEIDVSDIPMPDDKEVEAA